LAAITLQFEVGPETRALIERLAGKVILEIEFGPQTRKVIEALVAKGEREPAAGAPPAR
jgi:hypothetical protein